MDFVLGHCESCSSFLFRVCILSLSSLTLAQPSSKGASRHAFACLVWAVAQLMNPHLEHTLVKA